MYMNLLMKLKLFQLTTDCNKPILLSPLKRCSRTSQLVCQKKNSIDEVLKLAAAVQDTIIYVPGQTHFATTAVQSFAMRSGVCQNHAHIMLSLCRASNIPARYVSGYFVAEKSLPT
ncbi:transglutaminase-like domain-containing protein [Polynucleobacter necessarius]|uniref:transglutaminase-like domain-containing protein n=1 Tax=Polynucleobacter necessarius TaxID=576610 RepID=UPI0039E44D3A